MWPWGRSALLSQLSLEKTARRNNNNKKVTGSNRRWGEFRTGRGGTAVPTAMSTCMHVLVSKMSATNRLGMSACHLLVATMITIWCFISVWLPGMEHGLLAVEFAEELASESTPCPILQHHYNKWGCTKKDVRTGLPCVYLRPGRWYLWTELVTLLYCGLQALTHPFFHFGSSTAWLLLK